MRGVDCTPEQLKAAERFILARARRTDSPEMITQRFEDLVRLLAWYGAIRYKAGRDGISSLENPSDPT